MKKECWTYIFLFFFFLISMSLFATILDGDVLWNYGFSYAIAKGEIPYRDFNMIITPFYPILMSVPLFLSQKIIIFYISNALLMTLTFYYLRKLVFDKSWFFFILMVFPLPILIQPNYNFLLVFFVILFIYLEQEKKNDYLIGVLLGLCILTKQSVGICLLIPTMVYYWKEKKKILKRVSACLGIIILFFIYLLWTKSFFSFFDLCVFGLFDFTKKNAGNFPIMFLIGMCLIACTIYWYGKQEKSITTFYILMFTSIMIPLFDLPHILYFFFVFSLLWVNKISISPKEVKKNSILFASSFIVIFFLFNMPLKDIEYPNHYFNFEYRLMVNSHGENKIRDEVIRYIQKNKKKNIIVISSDAYFYQITTNQKINHFHLNNYGNHGYHGTKKMRKKINDLPKGTIFIINTIETEYQKNSLQFNVDIAKYAMQKGKYIQKLNCFSIYEIE